MKHTRFLFSALIGILPLLVASSPGQNSKENSEFKLAINLYNDGLYDLAAEQLRQFVALYSATSQGIEAKYYLGLTQMKLKQHDEARLTFQTFALTYQDNPKAPEAWWMVGESYAALRNYREAALAFERVKVFHPKSTNAATALVQAGKWFLLAGEPDQARRVLRVVLQEYASSPAVLPARTQLGQLYFAEGNLEQAQAELRRVVEGDPSPEAKAQALLVLGNIHLATGRGEEAEKQFREIIGKFPTSSALPGAYVALAKALHAREAQQEAADNLKKALASKNVDSSIVREALILAGDAHAALDDHPAAVRYYNMFFAAFPSDTLAPRVMWSSAGVNTRARNFKRSNELLNSILRSGAGDALKRNAMLQLARNAEDQKQPGQAIQFYDAYIEHYGTESATARIMMRAATLAGETMGDFRKAATYYELLQQRFSQSPLADDACMHAARCYEQLKDFDRALLTYDYLNQRYPSSKLRAEAMNRVRMITTFEVKDKDAGLEKLALLIGDLVSGKDKIGLSYRLGEVYFHDLKNYAAAAEQITTAINSGLTDSRFVNALYFRAQAYEFLSWKDPVHRDQAIASYETFVSSYPQEPRREDALLALFSLQATGPASAVTAMRSILAANPAFGKKDRMMLRLGELQQEAASGREAMETFSAIIREFPRSSSAREAAFRRIALVHSFGPADSTLGAASSYLTNFPESPYTAEVLVLGADAANRSGQTELAIRYLTRLSEEFPYTSAGENARRQLAGIYARSGNAGAAVALYTELLEEAENDPLAEPGTTGDLYLALGESLSGAGKTMEARTYLFRFLARQPGKDQAGRAYSLLGASYQKEGALEMATAYFRQAGAATASKEMADLLFSSGSYADAHKQYVQLARESRNENEKQHFEARIILSKLLNNDLTGIDASINAFAAQYKRADEDLASFELEKGSYYYRKQDYTTARKSFDRVSDKYDRTASAPSAMYWNGKILEATGKPQDALKLFDKIVKQYPRAAILPRVFVAIGNLQYRAERWDEAVQNYRRVVDDPSADPELLPLAMGNLIETYEAAAVFDAALDLTRRYLDMFPHGEDALDKKIKIGILYQRLGYNDQSVAHLQALLDEAGSDLEGELRYYIGEGQYNKGDYQQAILEFLKVPYLVTKKGKLDWTANSLYMAGQSYEKMNRHEQAVTMYQQILDRPGIDETFKAAARKEIDRVKVVLKKSPR